MAISAPALAADLHGRVSSTASGAPLPGASVAIARPHALRPVLTAAST
jgi:hypothetical protein